MKRGNQREHIIDQLDREGIASLEATELEKVQQHIKDCSPCRRAFESAWVHSALIASQPVEKFEAPSFFAERVMTRIRADESREGAWLTWDKIWKSAPGLVSSMVLLVVFLIGAAVVTEFDVWSLGSEEETAGIFSTEFIFVDGVQEGEIGYEEVLATLYESEGMNGN